LLNKQLFKLTISFPEFHANHPYEEKASFAM